jgi:hypothetical protein
MMLKREQRVEAQGLGEVAQGQMLHHHRRVGAPGLVQAVEGDPDLHGIPPILTRERSADAPVASTRGI